MEPVTNLCTEHNICFNFFSFGFLLASVFTGLCAIFLITLKNRSSGTLHMGLGFFYFTPFHLGYLYSALEYAPVAAYHRYLTLGFIMPAILHFTQWMFKFPKDSHPRTSLTVMIVQYVIALGLITWFIIVSLSSNIQFNLEAHYWDFLADRVSFIVGMCIFAYVIFMIGTGIWKAIKVDTARERWALIGISLSFFIGSIVPSVLNIMSRSGEVSRKAYILSLVLFLVLLFFLILIIFINTTRDRTTFMFKIVGVSLVTFLVTLTFVGVQSLNRNEKQYDALRREHVKLSIATGKPEEDVRYIHKLDLESGKLLKTFRGTDVDLDLLIYKADIQNTYIFDRAFHMEDDSFGIRLQKLLGGSHQEFAGYAKALTEFLKKSEKADTELRKDYKVFAEELDHTAKVNYNKLSRLSPEGFRKSLSIYLEKSGKSFAPFKEVITAYAGKNPKEKMSESDLKRHVLAYLRPFRPALTRHYRRQRNETPENYKHYLGYIHYVPAQKALYEVGFSYKDYRIFMHPEAKERKVILAGVLFVILGIFPLFFRGGLISPLNELISGIGKVNKGNLEVRVPVRVQDEIGFLANSFNKMVKSIRDAQIQLQDYANNLEDKVKERTAELNKTLEQVQALKTQQDGDYFLTSLLARPLNYNANKSKKVSTEFILKQKKTFEFRNRSADLGGDVCLTGNLRLGKPDNYRRYTVAINGDAMGKSMQGAGGALVMGVVMNSIIARGARSDRVLDTTPEQWLTDVYDEVHGVFLAFNGSMVISATIALVDNESGVMYYFNAEHPYQVILRNGSASFLEEELQLRKLGLESEFPFEVRKFQLEKGDIIIMGSDGRDDIDTTPDQDTRTINEDEYLFLKRVEDSEGNLERMVVELEATGVLTDDLSLLRLGFQEADFMNKSESTAPQDERVIIDIDLESEELETNSLEDFDELFSHGRKLARDGLTTEALDYLRQAYTIRKDVPSLNKTLAVLTFKEQDYGTAVEILNEYLQHDPNIVDFWLYLSIAHKRIGEYEKALEAANKVYELNSGRIPNLIQLADLHQKLGNSDKAREFIHSALEREPDNKQARALLMALNN